MPIGVKDAPDVLPHPAKEIFVGAFNSSFDDTCKERSDRDECASKIAWSAVKGKFKKSGDQWVAKAALVDIELIITKASVQEDGTLRFQLTASDTDPDNMGDCTSIVLFADWIERIEKGIVLPFLPPPAMPFLGVSHYPELGGLGEAGLTERMWIQGKRFKADGVFLGGDDHPLGPILFRAVRDERDLKRAGEIEKPIRISAAWWDLQHSHNNFTFTRRSLSEMCPMCVKGVGDKMYLAGQLHHFASTRVPIHPSTALSLEEKAMIKTTRREDAASIVGDEHADKLEAAARGAVGKSGAGDIPDLVIKAEPDVKKHDDDRWLPLGGATSLDEAESYIETRELVDKMWNQWDMFNAVMMNILDMRPEDGELESDLNQRKLGALRNAADQFSQSVNAIKANVVGAYLLQPVQRGETMTDQTQGQQQALTNDPAAQLGVTIKAALENPQLNREGKLAAIQEALNGYTETVKAQLDAVAPPVLGEQIAAAIEKSLGAVLQPFAEQISLLNAKLGRPQTQQQQVPQQKSFSPGAQPLQPGQAQLPTSPVTKQVSPLTAMIRRSVGIVE